MMTAAPMMSATCRIVNVLVAPPVNVLVASCCIVIDDEFGLVTEDDTEFVATGVGLAVLGVAVSFAVAVGLTIGIAVGCVVGLPTGGGTPATLVAVEITGGAGVGTVFGAVGAIVGAAVGAIVGATVGAMVGAIVGAIVGTMVGDRSVGCITWSLAGRCVASCACVFDVTNSTVPKQANSKRRQKDTNTFCTIAPRCLALCRVCITPALEL